MMSFWQEPFTPRTQPCVGAWFVWHSMLRGTHRPRVVEHALSSTDSVIRLWGSRHVRPCFLGKALEGILGSLSRDGFMPVRREALIIQAETSADSGRGVWRRALLDGNASIRELARFHLGEVGRG